MIKNKTFPIDLQLFAAGPPVMDARDIITGSLASCWITLEGRRLLLMQAKKLEAKMEKEKKELAILGKVGKANRATGMKNTGSMTMYYNTSIFRELVHRYQETGQDFYFDIQVTNEDPTSTIGRQTIILKDCNIDGAILATFDADAEALEETMDFTFERFEIPEKFSMIAGME